MGATKSGRVKLGTQGLEVVYDVKQTTLINYLLLF